MRLAAPSVIALSLLLTACGESEAPPAANLDFQKQLQTQLIKAKPGEVVEIPAGTWQLDRSLSLKVSGVTLRGAGMDQSILNFKGQKSGAEGLLVNASDFTIEDLALEDTKGDALKVVGEGINAIMRAPGKAVLLITHYQRLLDYIKPDVVHVLADGRIVQSGGPELALQLEEHGYDFLKNRVVPEAAV